MNFGEKDHVSTQVVSNAKFYLTKFAWIFKTNKNVLQFFKNIWKQVLEILNIAKNKQVFSFKQVSVIFHKILNKKNKKTGKNSFQNLPGYCIQCGSSNPLEFIGFSLKPKVLGVCNAPSTNGSYGYIGIGGGNLLTLPTPVVKPNTTPAVI